MSMPSCNGLAPRRACWGVWWATLALAEEYDPDRALTTRWAEPEGYFAGGARELLGYGADGLDYDVGEVRAVVYVPDGPAPADGWGVYVHVDADDHAELPGGWREVLAAHGVLYVAPHGVGNERDVPLRIAWALDALATAEATWQVDPDRRVIGGFSGGGAVAAQIGAFWPEVFVGTIDQCRAVMWELHEIDTMPGSAFGMGEVDALDPDHLDTIAEGPRFAFVSGDRDFLGPFSNYEGIMDGIGDWWERGVRARVFDVPELAHQPAPGGPFDAALGWVLDCADDGRFPPRFDLDHLPPASPFPTPDAAPPEACDAAPPTPVPPHPIGEPETGCSCSSARPGYALLCLLALRRRRSWSGSTARDPR
jgi:hypothetical protein